MVAASPARPPIEHPLLPSVACARAGPTRPPVAAFHRERRDVGSLRRTGRTARVRHRDRRPVLRRRTSHCRSHARARVSGRWHASSAGCRVRGRHGGSDSRDARAHQVRRVRSPHSWHGRRTRRAIGHTQVCGRQYRSESIASRCDRGIDCITGPSRTRRGGGVRAP